MASIGPVVSEKKMFENVDDGRMTDDGRTDDKNFHPLILNISKMNAATSTKILQHIYSLIPDYINIPNLKSFNRIGQEKARAPRVLSTVYIRMNSFMYTVF